jgi:hypothetical protein
VSQEPRRSGESTRPTGGATPLLNVRNLHSIKTCFKSPATEDSFPFFSIIKKERKWIISSKKNAPTGFTDQSAFPGNSQ